MDLPLGPATERPDALSPSTLQGVSNEPSLSHGETLAAAVDADPIAQAQANVLRSAYGEAHIPDVLAAVHAAGPGAIADLTEHPERYGPFRDTPETRVRLTMLAGTLPNMDDYGGINTVLARASAPGASTDVARSASTDPARMGEAREVAEDGERGRGPLDPRAPDAEYPALDDRLAELRTQIRAGGPGVDALREEASLIQATSQAARYLGAPGMTPTRYNPIDLGGNQAMTVPTRFGTIYANDVNQMIDELGHMVQYNRNPLGFVPKIGWERATGGDDVYRTPGKLENEAHYMIKPEIIEWIHDIQEYNAGRGSNPFSPDNPLFRKLMDYPDIARP